jgi:tryptophan 7-halogenase
MKNIVVLGGGVIGWFTAALLQKRHPDLKITLIESPYVPILGVGESTIPQLGDLLSWLDIDEKTWMKNTHGIYKLGNHFVGWNSDLPKPHVTNHWNAPLYEQQFYSFSFTMRDKVFKNSFYHKLKNDDFFYDNDGRFGVDHKSFDYWLELVRQGKYNWWEVSEYCTEQYFPAMANKSPYDMEDNLSLGDYKSYAWHVDAERFPVMIRDMVALPSGVEWVEGHVEDISKDEDGSITSLILRDGRSFSADLYVDCTGFNRVLMKTMDTPWIGIDQLPCQSAWVAPVKYNDPYKEMKPYTQSYAQANGWNFIISLYSRMGSGYIFDINSEDPDDARERFIKYWDGYEFIREPRMLHWEQGYYKDAWIKNVVGVGMGQGFIDPMEANSIYVAQSCMEMLDKALTKYKGRTITESAKKAYSRQVQKLENQISDFIACHFTLSKRQDNPMWRKAYAWGKLFKHTEMNWHEYRAPRGYLGRNIFLDYQWAQQQHYLDRWDDDLCKLNIDKKLLPLADIDFNYIRSKGKALAEYLPHIYDWSKERLHEGATHEEVLQQALAER